MTNINTSKKTIIFSLFKTDIYVMIYKTQNKLTTPINMCYRASNYKEDLKRYMHNKRDHLVMVGQGTSDR